MSSSLPLTFNSLHSWQKPSKIPSEFNNNVFVFPNFNKPTSLLLSKSHICFTFNNNTSSEYEREETRWLREEQRWMREEQRWIRQEQRWEAERESLLNEIKTLKLEIEELRREGGGNTTSVSNVAKLLRVLKKEVNQIGDSGSSASPLVVETAAAVEDGEEAVEDVAVVEDGEEVVVKEVIRVADETKGRSEEKEVMKKRAMLRVGSEGDQVQKLQEALLKLGFYCGEEDEEFSSFSSGTERAVKTWQASIGVPETGVMTAELLDRLYTEGTSGFKEGENGVAMTSVTKVPEILSRIVKDYVEPDVSDTRVFLLGENRWEDSSRLINRNKQDSHKSQTDSKGVVTTRCITCCGIGHLQCAECDGTGEPNIEPQFLEWVGEDTKCPYCEGIGHTICDVCHGTGATGS